jgi:hypothetical protein
VHMQDEMARLGAEGVSEAALRSAPQVGRALLPVGATTAPPGQAAVGGRVSIFFSGAGIWCCGEVLAYDAAKEVPALHFRTGNSACPCFPSDYCSSWIAAQNRANVAMTGDSRMKLSACLVHGVCRCTMFCTKMASTSGSTLPLRRTPGLQMTR